MKFKYNSIMKQFEITYHRRGTQAKKHNVKFFSTVKDMKEHMSSLDYIVDDYTYIEFDEAPLMTKEHIALSIMNGHNICESDRQKVITRAKECTKKRMETIYRAFTKDRDNWAFYIALFSDLSLA